MIKPQPFKYQCPQCGYSKIVKPKSDALNPVDWINSCPKCKTHMNKMKLNLLEKIFNIGYTNT